MTFVSNADHFDRVALSFLKNRPRPSDTDEELVIIDTEGRPLLSLVGKEGFLLSVRLSNQPTIWMDGRIAAVIYKAKP